MKNAKKMILFVIIGTVLFLNIQFVLTERPIFAYDQNEEYLKIGEMYNLEKDSIDVLFLGTSQINFSVSPMEIYKKTNISSFNLGTATQSYMLADYLLHEFYKTQSPKIVFVDVSSLFVDGIDYYSILPVTNNTHFSKEKLTLCKNYYDYLKRETTITKSEAITKAASIVLPFLSYKDRWMYLNSNDVSPFIVNNYYLYGYTPASHIVSSNNNQEKIEQDEEDLLSAGYFDDTNNNYSISRESAEWLKTVIKTCHKNNSEIVLIKPPKFISPIYYLSKDNDLSWNYLRYQALKKWLQSEKIEVPYIDFAFDTEIAFDPFLDTYDYGGHLNYGGALKVSSYLADYLITNYSQFLDFSPKQCFENALPCYERMTDIMLQEMDLSFDGIMGNCLSATSAFEVIIVYNSQDNYINDTIKDMLNNYGFRFFVSNDICDRYVGAYIAVADGEGGAIEVTDKYDCEYILSTAKRDFTITSSNRNSSIKDDYGTDYSLNWPGFNFVIYDKLTGCCIDSFNIQGTYDGNYGIYRDAPTISTLLKNYEKTILSSEQ